MLKAYPRVPKKNESCSKNETELGHSKSEMINKNKQLQVYPKMNEKFKKNLGCSKRKTKEKLAGISLDSWHLHVAFLFSSESCLLLKNKVL